MPAPRLKPIIRSGRSVSSRSSGAETNPDNGPRTAMSAFYVDFSRLLGPSDYQGAGSIGFDLDALIEILRIANAIGNAAAQSSAMTQNARGPRAP